MAVYHTTKPPECVKYKDNDLKCMLIDMIKQKNIETIFIDYSLKDQVSIDIVFEDIKSHMGTLENIPEEGIDE